MTPEPKLRQPFFELFITWTTKVVATVLIPLGLLVLILFLVIPFASTGPSYSPLARAATEITALGSALEAYEADHGHCPSNPATDELAPNLSFDPAAYTEASACLYEALSKDAPVAGGTADAPSGSHAYYQFEPRMLRKTHDERRTYIVDPWGNSYGYSTFQAKHPERSGGHNPGYDLWSTTKGKTKADQPSWIKNW